MRWALISLSLMCCSASWAPRCITACGMYLWGSPIDGALPPGWSCESLAIAESKAVAVLGRTTDQRAQRACAGAQNVSLYVAMDPTWEKPTGETIAGEADCDLQRIEVGSSPPLQGALAHELAHIAQNCNAPLPIDKGRDRAHSNWDRALIFPAVDIWYPEP